MESTVNIASRLQCLAENDEIIVSRKLKNMVQGKFEFLGEMTKDRGAGKNIKSFRDVDIVYDVREKK
jgi:class 3 adenylate cyclase